MRSFVHEANRQRKAHPSLEGEPRRARRLSGRRPRDGEVAGREQNRAEVNSFLLYLIASCTLVIAQNYYSIMSSVLFDPNWIL